VKKRLGKCPLSGTEEEEEEKTNSREPRELDAGATHPGSCPVIFILTVLNLRVLPMKC
jgi:hypothetical protein